jgi:tetratricopeptide (TPR) repeat protein/serine/threonine protein kinase
MQEQSIFIEALEREDPTERAAFLDRACGGDTELRRRIEKLLLRHAQDGSFLESPTPSFMATIEQPPREGSGTVIGPYKLLQPIGEGGMGAVFMAEQTQPVQRKVALKLIKPGMDSRQVVARFEAERQALALMDHPNIAKVFDGGATESGRPYFVMELVKGVPITTYCDEHRLTPRQRLELFVPVCEAVQHAHQKGVIHRDLKPSNVLAALYDGKPIPKVIDFGVAKAAGQPLTDKTLFTGFGAVVGTLEYMSPEQAELNQLDIDTRSDIYSLGVLLYELLTGTTPLERKRLKDTGLLEALRLIREEEPPRPSARLSTTAELPAVAASRGLEPRKLSGVVRGELDWIVMKALEKDRNRRYESANGFAQDIRRYLADEPVQACPPSAWYRLWKFVRRNRMALAVTGLIVFFIAVVVGGGGWALRDRAAREETAAQERRDRAQRLTARVEQMLDDVGRLEREQKWAEARAAADRAEAALEGGEADAAVRQRLADARRELAFVAALDRIRQERSVTTVKGWFDHAGAARHYALAFRDYGVDVEALPAEEAVARLRGKAALAAPVAAALDDWAGTRQASGEGQPSWEPLVAVARGLDPDVLRDRVRAAWGQEVTPGLQADLRRLAESIDVKAQSPATLIALADTLERTQLADAALRILREGQYAYPTDFWLNLVLGKALLDRKDCAGALRYFTAAVSLRPDSAIAHNILGVALHGQKKPDEAVAEYRKAVELDPNLAMAHYNLGIALHQQGKLDEAVAAYRKAVELDPNRAMHHYNLGIALHQQGKLDEAVAAYRKAVEVDPKDAGLHSNLGKALKDQGKLDDAVAEFRKAVEVDPQYVFAHNNLGDALREQGKSDEAIAEYRRAIQLDPKDAKPHNNLAIILQVQGRLDEAVAEYCKAIELDPKLAPDHNNLGDALRAQGKLNEAVAECRKAIELDPKLALAHNNLGNALRDQGKLDEAVAEHHKAIELDPKLAPAHFSLGLTLYEQKKLDESVAEYRKAIELAPKDAMPHMNLGNALYAQGKLEEAVAEHREALRLKPDLPEAHLNLGVALYGMGRLDEAIAEHREALRLKPGLPEAHLNLGVALYGMGRLDEAIAEYREALRLKPDNPLARNNLRVAERLGELSQRLPAILEGKDQPKDAGERLALAQLCQLHKKLFAAAAHFYAEAFAAQPALAERLGAPGSRYDAASAAALAGCGQGHDAGGLDAPERARLRRQALDWLRADLDAWGRTLDQDVDKARPVAVSVLQHWLEDRDFAGVRGPEALAKLPEPERQSWQKLWDDAADMLARAQAKTTPEKKPDAN